MRRPDVNLLELSAADAQRAWRLAHGLDLQLEGCQHAGCFAEQTLDTVVPWIMKQIGARAIHIRLVADGEIWKSMHYGADRGTLGDFMNAHPHAESDDGLICCLPLTLHDEDIGHMAASFDVPPGSPGGAVLLEVASQELDNVLFELRRARQRHRQVMEIGRHLQQHVLDSAIDSGVAFLAAQTGAAAHVVAYSEDQGDGAKKCCRVYRDGRPILTCYSGDGTPLGRLLGIEEAQSPHRILEAAGLEARSVGSARIETGLQGGGDHGVVLSTGPAGSVTGANLELLQNFAAALGQRLVDYHKDRRFLQQFFAPPTVSRLLSFTDYHRQFLSPRLQDVAMLYADITSFTKISEQILSTPEEVGQLIDHWSNGVVQLLFEHGGVFDKMVGDCVIGLFGTPFDDLTPAERVAGALEAALEIRRYTAALAGFPVVDKIRGSDLIPGLGVATGVNFGTVMVGTFGPDNAFTAFGREMNNTARLQGVAGYQEILVMGGARKVLASAGHPLDTTGGWGQPCEAAVKNVREPLRYFPFGLP